MQGSVQRQITLTLDEDEQLRQRAQDRGISEEALLREAVQQALGGETSQTTDVSCRVARQEWEQVKAFMRARVALPVSQEERSRGRGWTRAEIYDERLDRTAR
ncbi:MAG: ribbon-helix-helix protein, CopG family [Dehalococcoidia bacterium]